MPPKVSVCLITYNHQNYIGPCLDNILSQQTDFDFEIVIGEDKSTDNTPQIIKEYQQKHPEKIRIIDSANNVGMVANWERTLHACKGKYIAIIEGDDCWTANHKLQKQVNMLDANPDYAMCFHDVEVEFGEGVVHSNPLGQVIAGEPLGIKDIILRNWFIPTCSMMIRSETLPPFPAWTRGLPSIDIVVQLFVTMHGDIGYLPEKMGLYRVHGAGISQVQWLGKENKLHWSVISIMQHFDTYSKGKYHTDIDLRLHRVYKGLMLLNPSRSKEHLKAMFEIIKLSPANNKHLLKDWLIVNIIPSGLYKIYGKLK